MPSFVRCTTVWHGLQAGRQIAAFLIQGFPVGDSKHLVCRVWCYLIPLPYFQPWLKFDCDSSHETHVCLLLHDMLSTSVSNYILTCSLQSASVSFQWLDLPRPDSVQMGWLAESSPAQRKVVIWSVCVCVCVSKVVVSRFQAVACCRRVLQSATREVLQHLSQRLVGAVTSTPCIYVYV